jgi:hypothetical protein
VNFASGGHNKLGLLLAVLAVTEKVNRRNRTPGSGQKQSKMEISVPNASAWPAALSLGALLYALHAHLGDSGTLISWSWTGYPVKGPIAGFHNPLVFLAMACGFLLSSFPVVSPVMTSPAYVSFGATSLYCMYNYRDWPGFFGGLGYTVFLCSIVPTAVLNAASCIGPSKNHMGKVFGSAGLVYALFVFADVWTVAYAFVPGGVYLRERTDLLVLLGIVLHSTRLIQH